MQMRAVKICLTAVAVAFVAMAIAIVPMLSSSVLTLSPSLAAKLATVGGTNNPTAKYVETLVGGSLVDGRTIEPIYTPQQFWPVNGPLTLDESVMEGRDNVLAWAVVETDQDVTLLTVSQGSVVLSQVIARWNDDLENAPPAHQFRFVLLANPMRPNGGALARLPGLSVFGVNFYGPTEESQYEVTDSAFAYDLFATAPMYLNNPLSLFNAFAGVAFPYGGGNSLHGTDPDWTDPDLDVRTEVHGNTTYHTIIPKNLPMLEPLRMVGLGAFADVIQPVLKVWVDAGYYKNDPAASPGVHMAAQLFMPLENIISALVQTPAAVLDGLATIPGNLGLAPNRSQPSQTEEPPVVDDGDSSIGNRLMSTSSNIMSDLSNDNKEGDGIVTDLPKPDAPEGTSGQAGGELSGSIESPQLSESPVATGGEDEERQVPDQEPSVTPDTLLDNESPENTDSPAPSNDEVNENEDDSSSLFSTSLKEDDQEKVSKKSGKKFDRFDGKDDKEDEDSSESKLTTRSTRPETASSPKNDDASNNRSPSGSSSAGNEGNDTANAA